MRRMGLVMLVAALPGMAAAEDAWIRIEAKRGAAAEAAVAGWRARHGDVQTFRLPGGFTGIALGPMDAAAAAARMAQLKAAGDIPADSYLTAPGGTAPLRGIAAAAAVGAEAGLPADATTAPATAEATPGAGVPQTATPAEAAPNANDAGSASGAIDPAASPAGDTHIQLQATPGPTAARAALAEWRKTFPEAALWRTRGGMFVVALPAESEAAASGRLRDLKAGGQVPRDAFLARTAQLGAVVEAGVTPQTAGSPGAEAGAGDGDPGAAEVDGAASGGPATGQTDGPDGAAVPPGGDAGQTDPEPTAPAPDGIVIPGGPVISGGPVAPGLPGGAAPARETAATQTEATETATTETAGTEPATTGPGPTDPNASGPVPTDPASGPTVSGPRPTDPAGSGDTPAATGAPAAAPAGAPAGAPTGASTAGLASPPEPDPQPAPQSQPAPTPQADPLPLPEPIPAVMPPIEEVQRALRWAGRYDGQIDGQSGPGTRAAIDAEIAATQPGQAPADAMVALIARRDAWRREIGLAPLDDPATGLSMTAPVDRLAFERVERGLSIYGPKDGSGAALILTRQPGGQQEMLDFAGLVTVLGWVPAPERTIARGSVTLTGRNAQHLGHAEARVVDGEVRGWVLIWPAADAGNGERLAREIGETLTAQPAAPSPDEAAAPLDLPQVGGGG